MTETSTIQLHKLVEEALPQVDTLIGWAAGSDPLRAAPVFVRGPESVSQLLCDPFCAQNLTGYLVKPPALKAKSKEKKIGVCVKGCDSRSLVALIQEKFIERDELYVIGVPCAGTVDWRRVAKLLGPSRISAARMQGETLAVEDERGVHEFSSKDVLARKCLQCRYPNPLIYNVLVSEPVQPRAASLNSRQTVRALDEKPLETRLAFWQSELSRCMRCYACRNACPLCVCQDRCIAETRDPKWLTQRVDLPEKFLFHLIHTMHLSGRCTECGECERVCPVEIPVMLMREKVGEIVKETLSYEAGLDPEAVPPLLTFDPSETGV